MVEQTLSDWARRVDVAVAVRGPVGDAGWKAVQAILGELHQALPEARAFRAAFEVVEPDDSAPGAVGKMLMLRLRKAEGLQIRPPKADENADLVVEVDNEPGTIVYLHWQQPTEFYLQPVPRYSGAAFTSFPPKVNKPQ